jgi:hypothetical protein
MCGSSFLMTGSGGLAETYLFVRPFCLLITKLIAIWHQMYPCRILYRKCFCMRKKHRVYKLGRAGRGVVGPGQPPELGTEGGGEGGGCD